MRKNKKFEAKVSKEYERKPKNLTLKKNGLEPKKKIVFSLRYFDRTQGHPPETWRDSKIFAKAWNKINGICDMTINGAIQNEILTIYDKGIPKGSAYTHPKHIDEDTEWASLRVGGKERIIGYIEDGYIFNIVFFDMEHKFYPSTKKHT